MPRESRRESLQRRRERIAAEDQKQRRWFWLVVAAFVLLGAVLLVKRGLDSRPLDLNRATVEQLQTLPGVGPATARELVKGRPFRSVEELERVKGIGPDTLKGLRDRVRVAP